MSVEQVYEGTWEEVAGHTAALRGKRVRLIVLPQESDTERTARLRARATQLNEERDALERIPGSEPRDSTEREWGEAIEEKHRKQGIEL